MKQCNWTLHGSATARLRKRRNGASRHWTLDIGDVRFHELPDDVVEVLDEMLEETPHRHTVRIRLTGEVAHGTETRAHAYGRTYTRRIMTALDHPPAGSREPGA